MTPDDAAALIEIEATFGRIMAFENDFITNQIIKFGAHTRPELAFLLSIVRPGDFIFDLGAHIGTYAIPLAQKIGGAGKLLAVEGKPENFSVLDKNLGNAGLAAETRTLNALIAPSALGYASRTPHGNTGGTMFLPLETAGVDVETVTIDELCRRYFMPRIVKIDIEGFEVFALAGSRLPQHDRPVIYVESNARLLRQQGTSAGALSGLLRDNGYELFRNIGDRNAPHDNFVAAELTEWPSGDRNLDVMAVHRDDERLEFMLRSISGG